MDARSPLIVGEAAAPAPGGAYARLSRAALAAAAFAAVALSASDARAASRAAAAYDAAASDAPTLALASITATNEYAASTRAGDEYPWLEGCLLVEPHRATTLTARVVQTSAAAAARALAADAGDGGDDPPASAADDAQDDERFRWTIAADASRASGGGSTAAGADDDDAVASLARGKVLRGRVVEHVFERVGWYNVTLAVARGGAREAGAGGALVLAASRRAACRYVRRELRALSDADRAATLAAMHAVYSTPQELGARAYGPRFRAIDSFVAEHLRGAASRECDHWHDGAGIMTHHVAFSLEFEQSLQAVDARVALPYWEYTLDSATYGDDWRSSPVFGDDWLGAASPNNSAHAVEAGRWAFLPVARADGAAAGESGGGSSAPIANPYGLLRSPWNTWKAPYVTRHGTIFGREDYESFPSCAQTAECFSNLALADINACLNGYTHGPVHIMLGGQWWGPRGAARARDAARPLDGDDDAATAAEGDDDAATAAAATDATHVESASERAAARVALDAFGDLDKVFLLVAKNVWRHGYMRCPAACSADTPEGACACGCPSAYLDGDDDAPYRILVEKTGVMHWVALYADRVFFDAADGRYHVRVDADGAPGGAAAALDETGPARAANATRQRAADAAAWRSLLGLLCDTRGAGEMYTSAAPWDPAFWLVHPAADRLLQLRRLVATRGNPAYALDESWGYTHDDAAPSDTGVVCDWSEADADSSELAVPTCAKGTCAGHGGADVLPMRIDGVDGPMTNLEFYKYMSPLNDALPYVYDSFEYTHCEEQGVSFPN